LLSKIGINIIIVHGGGAEITNLSQQLGIETKFQQGQRYTDQNTLKVVMMSLVGVLNKEIVNLVNSSGGHAIGLCGVDNNLIKAKKYRPYGFDLGLVGSVDSVNSEFLNLLLQNNMLPVIAPVGVGESGELYNINADLAAAAIASAVGAEKLFYLSDTEGILVDGSLIPTLTNGKAQEYIRKGLITGGMIPKVSSAFEALDGGVKKVHIVNGCVKHSLLLEVFTNEGVGTQIIKDEEVSFFVKEKSEEGKAFGNEVLVQSKQDPSHFIDFQGLSKPKVEELFSLADYLRNTRKEKPLQGKSISMIFQKPSLRTRVSFEAGIAQLGGSSVFLSNEAIGLGTRERTQEVAKVLSRYGDGLVARVFGHDIVQELAAHADVPVINALSDLLHPCQVMADMYTIRQYDRLQEGLKVVFVGDGNNLANSWLEMAGIYPMHLVISNPKGYDPDSKLLNQAKLAGISCIELIEDPRVAIDNADVVYTDVWASMGQEAEAAKRKQEFSNYQINKELLRLAKKEVLVMHCLPAHLGEEITEEVLAAHQSVIFDQAENRLHIQKAILTALLTNELPGVMKPSSSSNVGITGENYEQAKASVYH